MKQSKGGTCRSIGRSLLVAALIATGSGVLTSPASAADGSGHSVAEAFAPASDNPLRFWASTNGGTEQDQIYTDAEAHDLASRYDIVVGLYTTFRGQVDLMRAANPDLVLLAYQNGGFANAPQGTAFPDSWYLRDSGGTKVTSVRWGNWLMDPANSGWQQAVADECTDHLAASGFDGCYLDDLGSGNLISGNLSATPVNPRTGLLYEQGQWMTDTSALAASVDAQLPGVPVLANGINNGPKYFDPLVGSRRLALAADGGNAEGFLRGEATAIDKFRPEAAWRLEVDMLADAGAHGVSIIAMTKIWVPATAAQLRAWRSYTYASFLLGTDGNQFLYFNATGPGHPPVADPYDDVNLGAPLAPYARIDGVYQRAFERGLALVNPTTTPVTVPLGRSYVDLDGNTVSSITLGANSGAVLTATVATAETCQDLVATIVGTAGNDSLIGTPGNDVIWTGDGDDVISGAGGNDTICAGAGNDKVTGDAGDDWISGGLGDDVVRGNQGNDRVFGDAGIDMVYGGAGDDVVDGGDGVDVCNGAGQITADVARNCETATSIP